MYFKTISTELEKKGYSTQLHMSISSLAIWIDDNKGNPKVNSISQIRIEREKIIIQYPLGQIPVEIEFKTIDELLKLIRQVFPIDN